MLVDFLHRSFFGNTVLDYLTSAALLPCALFAIALTRKVVLSRLIAAAKKTESTFDDFLLMLLDRRVVPLLYVGATYVSVQNLSMNPTLRRGLMVAFAVLCTFLAAQIASVLAGYILERYWTVKEKDESRRGAFRGVLAGVRVVLWGIAGVLLLDNLGVKISALMAGLGIGGVAIALASQAVLGDLFSYFAIFFDRPFEIGDFIIVGEYMGAVEQIGVKTTRLRSLSGEQIVFCNTDLIGSRVRNYKRMEKRRVNFKIGVTYNTPTATLKEIAPLLRSIVESMDGTTIDRSHFAAYGDFSLIFEVVYYVNSAEYARYMDIQQEINLRIREEFEKRGIQFAYPTQTLYLAERRSEDERDRGSAGSLPSSTNQA